MTHWNLKFGGTPDTMFAADPNAAPSDFGATWTVEQMSSFLLLTDNQDMDAINRFISDTVAVTPEAVKLKDSWLKWWDSLGWWEKNVGTETYDEARNRRNAFILANQTSSKAKEEIKEVIKRGIETEEASPADWTNLDDARGQTRRVDSEGKLPDPPPPPIVPTWVKTGGIIAVLGGIALGIVKIVSTLNPAALALKLAAKKGQK